MNLFIQSLAKDLVQPYMWRPLWNIFVVILTKLHGWVRSFCSLASVLIKADCLALAPFWNGQLPWFWWGNATHVCAWKTQWFNSIIASMFSMLIVLVYMDDWEHVPRYHLPLLSVSNTGPVCHLAIMSETDSNLS